MLTATELAHFNEKIAPAAAHARRVNLMAEKTDPEIPPAPVAPAQPKEEPAMPRGVYERTKTNAAPKKRGRPPKADTPPVAKKACGQYAGVLAELHAKREQIDAAIEAIEALA